MGASSTWAASETLGRNVGRFVLRGLSRKRFPSFVGYLVKHPRRQRRGLKRLAGQCASLAGQVTRLEEQVRQLAEQYAQAQKEYAEWANRTTALAEDHQKMGAHVTKLTDAYESANASHNALVRDLDELLR